MFISFYLSVIFCIIRYRTACRIVIFVVIYALILSLLTIYKWWPLPKASCITLNGTATQNWTKLHWCIGFLLIFWPRMMMILILIKITIIFILIIIIIVIIMMVLMLMIVMSLIFSLRLVHCFVSLVMMMVAVTSFNSFWTIPFNSVFFLCALYHHHHHRKNWNWKKLTIHYNY